MSTVSNLIAELRKLPPDWEVYGTNHGSLWVAEPGYKRQRGQRYGYVFPNELPPALPRTKLMRVRKA